MGADVINTHTYLKDAAGAVQERHCGPYGALISVVGTIGAPVEAWMHHHLGIAGVNSTSPKAVPNVLKSAALSEDLIGYLRAHGEGDLADWMEASPQGVGWIEDHGWPALKEWAES